MELLIIFSFASLAVVGVIAFSNRSNIASINLGANGLSFTFYEASTSKKRKK